MTRKSKVSITVESLGMYLREQRVAARLSLRQLAEQAGVSNPYLSQIERGLRKPSAEVLQQLARALRISAEQLYVQAGILNPDDVEVRSVELAILADRVLSERQKQSLLEVYQSFRAAAEATSQTLRGNAPVEPAEAPAPVDVPAEDTASTRDDGAGESGPATPHEGD